MRGLAINISVLLIAALIVLVVLYLILGVFKDFVFQQQRVFGLTPGTKTLIVTDRDLIGKASIECQKLTENFEYRIILNQVGFDYPSTEKVFPVFFFKSVIGSSQPEEVEIPGRISFSSAKIISKIPPSPTGSESVVLGFFKDEKCLNLAKSSPSFDNFVNQCAKALETEISIVAKIGRCS